MGAAGALRVTRLAGREVRARSRLVGHVQPFLAVRAQWFRAATAMGRHAAQWMRAVLPAVALAPIPHVHRAPLSHPIAARVPSKVRRSMPMAAEATRVGAALPV